MIGKGKALRVVLYDSYREDAVRELHDDLTGMVGVNVTKETLTQLRYGLNGERYIILVLRKNDVVEVETFEEGVEAVETYLMEDREWDEVLAVHLGQGLRVDIDKGMDYIKSKLLDEYGKRTLLRGIKSEEHKKLNGYDKVLLKDRLQTIRVMLRLSEFKYRLPIKAQGQRKNKSNEKQETLVEGKELKFVPNKRGIKEPLYYKDGELYLKQGTKVYRPKENVKAIHSERMNKLVDELLEEGLLEDYGTHLLLTEKVTFRRPSPVAGLVCGEPRSGWDYFNVPKSIREDIKKEMSVRG